MKKLTLGSLFDGIGGFCLAGVMSGIHPEWSSEIEPFPVRVTEKNFPDVSQLGDVHSIDGGKITPVDIVTFGSPCQNLSIAGKRTGLDGEQSSLFFEAVRIITEMRCKTNGQYPRWCVWENVPGALSSNNGYDFRQVLESLVQIKDTTANVPMPASGKWLNAGEIVGDGYSVAWRILDASKGWGVAQRRRRIFAVIDLADCCAGQVLFESEGLSGYTPPSFASREGTSDYVKRSIGASGFNGSRSSESGLRNDDVPLTMKIRGGREGGGKGPLFQRNLSATLATNNDQTLFEPKAFGICSDASNAMCSENPHCGFYEAETSRTIDTNGGNPVCNQGGIAVVYGIDRAAYNQGKHALFDFSVVENESPTLVAKGPGAVCAPAGETYALQGNMIGRKDENGPMGKGVNTEVSFTLNTIDRHAVCAINDHPSDSESGYLVRRLTPLECCRLQGYPDDWCSELGEENPTETEVEKWREVFSVWDTIQGRKGKRTDCQIIKWLQDPNTDAAEYKAYGNSVAVPCVFFVLAGIVWAEGKEDV